MRETLQMIVFQRPASDSFTSFRTDGEHEKSVRPFVVYIELCLPTIIETMKKTYQI